uniref:mRNA interferase YafQ n=1 Tax=Candidatus Kentrum sp. FW TaxID=2126338 RepID=A0A450THI2_9GAMM|nr:MAG: mRNA interferase YafQ [Candidatus Kentron sp. FW]
MRYPIRRTGQFRKDVKQIDKLLSVIDKLAKGERLSRIYRDHPLKGGLKGKRDCHIGDDWLLLYAIEDDELILYRTGTHAQLFR